MVGRIVARWDRLLFEPEPATTIAVYRILFGLLILAWAAFMGPERMVWFGTDAVLTPSTARQFPGGPRLGLFPWLPAGDAGVRLAYWGLVIAAAGLTLGLFTRLSCIGVFVLFSSFIARNPAVMNAGDSLLRIVAFFLIFTAAGKALSLDRLRRIALGRESARAAARYAPWAQRLIQLQFSLVYVMSYAWKIRVPTWRDGTALYFIGQLEEFHRFPVPVLFDYLGAIKLMTWGTLAVELALGVLIWFRRLRPYVLAAGVLLHVGMEYSMNIPLFQWIMIATMATFVEPQAYTRAAERVRRLIARLAGRPRPVVYDGGCLACARAAAVVTALDVLGRFLPADSREPGEPGSPRRQWRVQDVRGRWREGFDALRWVAWRLPLLWPFAWLLYVPPLPSAGRRLWACGVN